MSAFVVDKAHINALVNAGLGGRDPLTWYHNEKYHKLHYNNADEVGQMLLNECIRSVGARYQDSEVTDLPGRVDAEYLIPFKHKLSYNPLPAVTVFSLINCYKYQSCETDDWEQTEAYAFCQQLEGRLIRNLPGYDDAPWEWTQWPEETLKRIC